MTVDGFLRQIATRQFLLLLFPLLQRVEGNEHVRARIVGTNVFSVETSH